MSRLTTMMKSTRLGIAVFGLGLLTNALSGAEPSWIWGGKSSTKVHLRKTFDVPLRSWNARLTATSDGPAQVYLNGKLVGRIESFDQPFSAEVMVRLNQGANVIAIESERGTHAGGVVAHLDIGGKPEHTVVSDGSWRYSDREEKDWRELHFDHSEWQTVSVLGEHGDPPWGDILFRPMATAASAITVPEGFTISRLRSATPDEGSWVSMVFDPKGRIVVSSQDDEKRLLRFTLGDPGEVSKVETLSVPISFAMGMLFAHGHFYVNGTGPEGTGLYRLTDSNKDDHFSDNEVKLLQKFHRSGEHGYHGLALGPDGWIYVMNGNSTPVPSTVASTSSHRNFANDFLLPSEEAMREQGGQRPPAGHVLRTDPEGKTWELYCGGFRNAYDLDFSPEGELFTFDSDNEWDWGLPWYRPTIVHHATAGGEFGWREGIRLWPESYEDRLPDTVAIGIGSPTGVKFGTQTRFPERYRRALFVQDWSYGRILAVYLQPKGAGFAGTAETFLQGRPLNLTDLDIGPNGALYFITGGRNTQSGLYRVRWNGEASTEPLSPNPIGKEARKLRRQLENGETDLATLWPHLGSKDRLIRYAARLALERLPVDTWQERALAESDPDVALTALLALVRSETSRGVSERIMRTLSKHELGKLTVTQRLRSYRILQLGIIRHGQPKDDDLLVQLRAQLDARYPASDWPENRELARLLQWMNAPTFVAKTLELLQMSPQIDHQMHYVSLLSAVDEGWSLDQRRTFFRWWLGAASTAERSDRLREWFADVDRNYADGLMLDTHLTQFRDRAIESLSAAEREALGSLLEAPIATAQLIPAKPRSFVHQWQMSDFAGLLVSPLRGRDFERGRQAFVDAQCLVCHRFDGQGGALGPELDSAGSKYDLRSLLESILEPSKVINEQYATTTVSYGDDLEATGTIVESNDERVVIATDPLSGTKVTIPRSDVHLTKTTSVSSMPPSLVNVLERDEILDLLAYLQSGGRRDADVFRK